MGAQTVVTGRSSPTTGGLKRTWRWYRSPGTDRPVARDDLEDLAEHGRGALMEAIARFRRGEERRGEVKKLTDCRGLWEIRVSVAGDAFRAIFFYDTAPVCVCVTAVRKNQQTLPRVDRARALERMALWQKEGKRRKTDKPPSVDRLVSALLSVVTDIVAPIETTLRYVLLGVQ